jgi:FMN phosphatase YigB (HAD superfamily)
MTNASDLHVPWVFDHLPRLRFFKDYAASWEMRAGKPDSVYYERALARFGVPAEGTLFVDDRPENMRPRSSWASPACSISTLSKPSGKP